MVIKVLLLEVIKSRGKIWIKVKECHQEANKNDFKIFIFYDNK